MPMQGSQWDHQAQFPAYGTDSRRDSYPSMHTSRNTHFTSDPQRCCPAPEPEVQAPMRNAAAMLPEELSVMRKALAEMKQVRAAKSVSMDNLPSYQGSTMDSLPSVDDLDGALPSGGVGQTQAAALMKALTGSDQQAKGEALEQVADAIGPMSVQRHGCRVAQKALEVADMDQKNMLAEGLR